MDEKEKIIKVISDTLGVPLASLQEDSDLIEDLNAQSLEIADLLSKLEDKFSLDISPDEINNIKTVGDILDLFLNP